MIISSDNGSSVPGSQGGSSGPWRGDFFTPPFEGSYRAAGMIRWPGKVPAGVVTDALGKLQFFGR